MSTDTTKALARATDTIAAIVTRQRKIGTLDVHDRAVLERSLGILRDGAPTLELIVSSYLAAGPGARLVVREREWGGHEALIVVRDEGEERIASRQGVDPETAALLRPLAGSVLHEWVQLDADAPPAIGATIEKVPEQRIEHGDGSGSAHRLDYLGVRTGRVIEVGAHWSNQPRGLSGWWVLVEYA